MNKQEWEDKFGGGREIARSDYSGGVTPFVFKCWVGDSMDQGFISVDGYKMFVIDDEYWEVVSKEKTIQDYPDVEVKDNDDDRWYNRTYIYSYEGTHYCISSVGGHLYGWENMRQKGCTHD